MAKQLTNDELNLKRKARRRLIGAIALTLAVVAILPMVLESEPKPSGKDIELRIPAPDKAGEFIPGKTVPEAALPPTKNAVMAEAARTDPVKPGVISDKEPVVASNPGVEVAGKIQVAANAQSEQKAQETKVTEPNVAESGSADKPESYVAQVGAYSNQNAAKHEVDRLKKWGFKVYTEKSDNMIRVRIGPYIEREKAEKVRQLLEKHDVHSVVMSVK